jgi:hypothetical protein
VHTQCSQRVEKQVGHCPPGWLWRTRGVA